MKMDPAGWADVNEVKKILKLSEAKLINNNNKTRFQLRDGLIRASQGHSLSGTPVTLSGLEASWEKIEPDKLLWHGTAVSAVEGIASKGLLPQKRSHVRIWPQVSTAGLGSEAT